MRRVIRVMVLGLLGVACSPGTVNAGRPARTLHPFEDLFVDPFLSDACGVDVTVRATGHYILRGFTDANGNLVHEVNNYAIDLTFLSENGRSTPRTWASIASPTSRTAG